MEAPQTLLRIDGGVVYDKRSLQTRVFRSQEVDADRLSLIGCQVEGLKHVACRLVQVRVGGKSRQHGIAGIANLHLQRVEGSGGRSLSGIDPYIEAQGRRGRVRGNRDLLIERIRMRGAVAVQP